VLAGYFAPEMHCSHVASIPTQPETSSQEDKIETAAQRDTGDALTPYTQLLGQTELLTVKAYSRGFRQGDIVVVEFDPAEHHVDSLKLSYLYKQTEKGKPISQKVQTATIDGKTYGFVAIDFEHPAQTVEVTVSASVDNLIFTENYLLTFVAADFQKQEMGKKSAITPAGKETSAQKKATKTFYNSWKTVTLELYAHDYSPPTTRECNVAGFGNYRSWEGQEKLGRHNGIDCSGTKDNPIQAGEPIYAIFDGVVTYASPEQLQLTGITTTIDHGFGLYTWYAHQSKSTVTINQNINAGDKIGEVGSTGRSSGPHLHIGAKLYGLNVNPDSLQILHLIIDNDNR
jgi:murein DD-endopeptidase MepM/ murein hydrolase activator NlpD